MPEQGGSPDAGWSRAALDEQPADPATARLTALSRAASVIVSARSLTDVATVAVRAGVEAVGAGGGTVAVRDDARGVLRLSSTEDYDPGLVSAHPELPLDADLPMAYTARTGERLLLADRQQALALFPHVASYQAQTDRSGSPIVAAAVLPLAAAGRLLGSLTLTWPGVRDFPQQDVDLLEALSLLVSQALDRVRSSDEGDRALARETLLARSGELLRAGFDRRAVLDATLDLVVPSLGDAALVRLADGTTHPPGPPPAPGPTTSTVQVPLAADGAELGSLVVVRTDGPAHTREEGELVRAVAARAALALAHALLFEEQRDTSVALQRALLTEPPRSGHLQVAVRYLPATHAAVGGDWYDAFLARDGAMVLAIGDVVGHDAEAAASMAQLRGLLRGLAYVLDDPPAAVLARTEAAAQGLSVRALATIVLARVERAEDGGRVLRWSSAGHLAPALLRADGTVQLLESAPDLMFGVDPDAERSDHVHPLEDSDTLLLYTDGLVERRGADLDDGLRRLTDHLSGLAGLAPDGLCDRLLADLLPLRAEDDVALVAVRVVPDGCA